MDASPEAVYRALVDPAAIARWRVPDGMTSEVHELDAREGGFFRVSLTYDATDATDPNSAVGKSAERTDTYHGHFVRLVPGRLVVEAIEFEAATPELAGQMTITTTLTASAGGTDVEVLHEGLPDVVPTDDNETGTRMALAKLARLVEGETG